MAGDRVRRRVVVQGRVQGVWFRAATEEQARALGLAGWVRNRADGSVEAVFEGAAEAVEAALRWCRRGPPLAVVERMDVRDEPLEGLADFAVERSAR